MKTADEIEYLGKRASDMTPDELLDFVVQLNDLVAKLSFQLQQAQIEAQAAGVRR